MKPEYTQWAEALLQEIYYTPEELRASLVETHLLKAVQRGYTDAVENDWWKKQESEKCTHNSDKQSKWSFCVKCGEDL